MSEQSITAPVPCNPDRDAFGHWLSGFVDGEGSFLLRVQRNKGGQTPIRVAEFQIGLRADDRAILEQVRLFLGCGTINYDRCLNHKEKHGRDSRPREIFHVRQVGQLLSIVVPHFHAHPLRAKKARDFVIWEQGVRLIHSVATRKRRCLGSLPGTVRKGSGKGFAPRWRPEEGEAFQRLVEALKEQRRYDAPDVPLPTPLPTCEPPNLFDGIN